MNIHVRLTIWFVDVYETIGHELFSEYLSSVHTDEPYNKLLIARLTPCTLCISGFLTLEGAIKYGSGVNACVYVFISVLKLDVSFINRSIRFYKKSRRHY